MTPAQAIEQARRIEALGKLVEQATSAVFGRVEAGAEEYGPEAFDLRTMEVALRVALKALRGYEPDVDEALDKLGVK